MSRFPIHPEQDPEPAAALYLSRLDHESLYSNAELRQAIAETTRELDDRAALIPRYTESLRRSGTGHDGVGHARRKWALRMAADLALDQNRADRVQGAGDNGAARPARLRRAS